MRKFAPAWHRLTRDREILGHIHGITLNFTASPDTIPSRIVRLRNRTEAEALTLEIEKLLEKKVIQKCEPVSDQVLSSVFLVKKPNGSFRTIFNMKTLNTIIKYEKFKMDTLETAKSLMRKDWYLASVDLSDAYFTVPVAPEFRKYLRFQFCDTLYEFLAMPQGLTSAPRIFTKILKPAMAKLRGEGCICMAYLDDILVLADSKESCTLATNKVVELVKSLGFIVNFQKSELTPTKSLVYLGYMLNTVTMQVSLPEEKVTKIKVACQSLLDCESVTLTSLAEIIGLMIAYSNASDFGPLHYRSLERVKNEGLKMHRGKFEGTVSLDDGCYKDLQWWIENAAVCTKEISHGNPSLVIHTDAALDGWGAHDLSIDDTTGGPWSEAEYHMTMNAKELKAIWLGLQTYCKNVSKTHVLVRSDNVTAVSYVKHMGGTVSPICNNLALELWDWCLERDIWLSVAHIPGIDNVEADFGSRKLITKDTEWSLNDEVFQALTEIWGTPEIDLFASRVNHKVDKYVAWHRDPKAQHVDAFTMSWACLYSYAFPPFSLLGKVLKKIAEDHAEVIVVLPDWPSAAWFGMVSHLLVDFPLLLPRMHRLLTQAQAVHKMQSHLLACRLSGDRSSVREFRKGLRTLSWRPGGLVQRDNITLTWCAGRSIVSDWGVIPFFRT